jgi:RNA polymerase sigma-70 factor (ECF subfamily)
MSTGPAAPKRTKPNDGSSGINGKVRAPMQATAVDAAARDSDIVVLLREGRHGQAFDALLERYEGKIFRLCCALLRDRAQAEDAAQESLLRVWKALGSYDGRASLSTWIYAITRNRCLTALTRRRAMESLSDSEVEAEAQCLASPEADGDGRGAELRELVDLLPERLRRTVLLYYFEERSTSEVALMLGCPEGTVKTHLFRARAALAEQLKKRGLDDASLWLE